MSITIAIPADRRAASTRRWRGNTRHPWRSATRVGRAARQSTRDATVIDVLCNNLSSFLQLKEETRDKIQLHQCTETTIYDF
ncbi:hypothetical protein Y032_0122g1094 [Ancylostoma ceylanicum]|uniref:Uncharacterized protein n=1 Tax=Ancylostoma ceylanicum TaxID=53326 RepID=A0A016TA23_9BILA|nr:hypothetical protein Y032_0122g1094 [Ancylostoma ceylanicum]